MGARWAWFTVSSEIVKDFAVTVTLTFARGATHLKMGVFARDFPLTAIRRSDTPVTTKDFAVTFTSKGREVLSQPDEQKTSR
jgi:hypothetical protein